MTHSIEGQCLCGQVRLRVTGVPLVTMACHCRGCQRLSASAYSLSSLYPSSAVEVTAGEPVIGGLHGENGQYFCPHCLSWLFTRPKALGDLVNVRATMLDDAASYRPFMETYVRDRLPWAATGAVHSFEEFPPRDRFPALLGEYVHTVAPPGA